MLRDLNSYLENVTSVGRSYLFMNATVSSETLRGQISAIADHRLHDEAILPSGTMLGVLHSDSTNPTLSDPADAYWALAAAMDKDSQHLGELMAAVTVYLNTLPAPSIASGFDLCSRSF
ncbi:MAG: hypothetical protein LR015_06085 [Verrucomicrobia bacterium]|nr:hypothetical protein [Verrucomicrobiota bacterium]